MSSYDDKRKDNYPFRLKVTTREQVDALAAQTGDRPCVILDQLIEYALSRARVGVVTRPGLVFENTEKEA